MAILGYLDASGDEALPAMSAAGFVAHEEQWEGFEKDWAMALKDEGLSEFHMKEFAHSVGEFKPWKDNEDRRVNFIKRLKEIIEKHTIRSFGFTLFVEEYKEVNRKLLLREHLGGPYALTTMISLVKTFFWKNREFPNEEILFFVEKGDNYQGELFGVLQRIGFEPPVTAMRKRWKENGTTRYCTPFQACDFIAYETTKATRKAFEKNAETITGRKSFLGILPKEQDKLWGYIDKKALLDLCNKFDVPYRAKKESEGR
ncbi:hypothetical protein MYX82_06640 [Acidobacteria bacterium AH-259-D05]|nr:hypothetical protein [Acidobacteria bacterium AH-259-D05]